MRPSTPNEPPSPGGAPVTSEARPLRPRGQVRRGAYLIPSLFTIGNLVLGFYAIIVGLRGDFERAVPLIFVAALVDGLDGRLARVTQTASDFGREFDSLADIVTFGVAPALLIHAWGLHELGRIGWLLPTFFLLCTAIRLARFNVHTRAADPRFFVGLPAPAAAGALGSLLFFADFVDRPELRSASIVGLAAAAVALGLLMVSTFRYYSFKELDPRRRWTFRIALPLAVAVLLFALQPAAVFLLVSGTYALIGPSLWLRGKLRRKEPLVAPPEARENA